MILKPIDRWSGRVLICLTVLGLLSLMALVSAAAPLKTFRIGFIEGGVYPQMESFRGAFRSQLAGLTAGEFEIQFLPTAYRTADWNRTTEQKMAAELAQMDEVDIIVALGPWVVPDLLAANCQKPIVAVHQYDPVGAGLLDNTGRPMVDNLVLGYDPARIRYQLENIKGITGAAKLGFLHFPGGSGSDSTTQRISRMASEMGMQVFTADGFDNYGTFAFFKAFRSLPTDLDAVYISPLWGFSTTKTAPFFEMVKRQRLPLFTSEGRFQVSRGAMVGFGSDNMLAEAHFHAYQAYKIMQGETPADLPVTFETPWLLTVNEDVLRICQVELPRGTLMHADRLGSSVPPGAEHYDLPRAIGQALAADANLAAHGERLEEARTESAALRARYLPQLNLNGSLGWVGQSTVDNSFEEVKKRQQHLTLRLEQSLLSSEVLSQTGLATLGREATAAQIDSVRADLTEAVTRAYLNYLRVQALEEVLVDYRRRLDLFGELSTVRQEPTNSFSLDQKRWQYERLTATKLIFQTGVAKERAKTIFNLLLSYPALTQISLDSSIVGTGQLVAEYSQAQRFMTTREKQVLAENVLVRVAQEQLPQLKYRSIQRNSAARQLGRQRFSFLPDIGLEASVGWADSLTDRAGEFSESPRTWSAGLKFDWPLFRGGGRFVERNRLHSWLDRAGYEADAALLRVVRQVRLSAQNWFSFFPLLSLAEESELYASEYLNGVTELYLAGQSGTTEMNAALDLWLEARIDGLEVRFGYLDESARLLRFIGGTIEEHGTTPGMAIIWYLAN